MPSSSQRQGSWNVEGALLFSLDFFEFTHRHELIVHCCLCQVMESHRSVAGRCPRRLRIERLKKKYESQETRSENNLFDAEPTKIGETS